MDAYPLLDHAKFTDSPTGNAVPVHKSRYGRVMVFALRDGQAVPEHKAPAPVHIVVLRGRGVFRGGGENATLEAPALVTLRPGEDHAVSADGEDLVFAVLLGNPMPAEDDADPGGAAKTGARGPAFKPEPGSGSPSKESPHDPPTDPIGD